MIQKIKGTMDILPDKTPLFRYIEGIMREEAEKYGFGEIRVPTFELTELFVRGVGDTTDVVQKEMYTFLDGEDSITLRPEGTAGVARALIENGKYGDTMPQKYYYIMSCFRHEKPQAGRTREFFQFGTEMFGADTPAADATVIALAYSVLTRLGLSGIRLHLNSIGCKACRPAFREALTEHFSGHVGEICDTCRERLGKNPLRLLDCKSPICSAIAKKIPAAIKTSGARQLVMSGGVAANSHLRAAVGKACEKAGAELILPPISLCGDNGVMVAAQGYYELKAGRVADNYLNASASDD